MAKVNFADILKNATVGEIEKPKPMPEGSYQALIKSIETGQTTGEKQTPYLQVNMEIVGALDDVDQAALQAFGPVNGKKVKTEFYLTDDALFRLQDFILDHVGLDLKGQTLDQAVGQLVNNTVGVHMKHSISKKDNVTVYSNVDKTFSLGK